MFNVLWSWVLSDTGLNQLGIVFNFFAGFMLAPQLIGLDRLKRLEENIETLTNKVDTDLEDIIHTLFLRNERAVLLFHAISGGF